VSQSSSKSWYSCSTGTLFPAFEDPHFFWLVCVSRVLWQERLSFCKFPILLWSLHYGVLKGGPSRYLLCRRLCASGLDASLYRDKQANGQAKMKWSLQSQACCSLNTDTVWTFWFSYVLANIMGRGLCIHAHCRWPSEGNAWNTVIQRFSLFVHFSCWSKSSHPVWVEVCLLNCNHYPPLKTAWSDYGFCLVFVCPVCLLWYVQSTRLCNPYLEAPPWRSTNYHLSDLWNDCSTNSICRGNFFRNPSCRVKLPLLLFGSFAPAKSPAR
jgi:hypothetical protein